MKTRRPSVKFLGVKFLGVKFLGVKFLGATFSSVEFPRSDKTAFGLYTAA
jgi:hypothetical protein